MKLFDIEKKEVKRYRLTDAAKKDLMGLILVCLGAITMYVFKEDCAAGIVLITMGLCVGFANSLK